MQRVILVRCRACGSTYESVDDLLSHEPSCGTSKVAPGFGSIITRDIPVGPASAPAPADAPSPRPGSSRSPARAPRGGDARELPARRACRERCAGQITAGELMTSPVLTVRQDATIWTAWGLLHGGEHRHLVVVDYHRRPIGVLDEQAITREWPHSPIAPHRKRVYDLTPRPTGPLVTRNDDIASVAKSMMRAGVDAAPVVDANGVLLGLITSLDLTALVAKCA